jgi:hypothetical protein
MTYMIVDRFGREQARSSREAEHRRNLEAFDRALARYRAKKAAELVAQSEVG